MAEHTLEELNQHIEEGLVEIRKMTADFPSIERFSHYNELLAVVTPTGILGSIRENHQNKKLYKYLSTKIYKGMSFDEIGMLLTEAAEDLSNTQVKVQKLTTPSDPCYYDNVKKIIDTLAECRTEWIKIAPEVTKEELTRASDGAKFFLDPQVEHWMNCEYIKMDLPQDYNEIKRSVDRVKGGNGCMVIILIAISATILAACSVL